MERWLSQELGPDAGFRGTKAYIILEPSLKKNYKTRDAKLIMKVNTYLNSAKKSQ